MIKNFNVKSIKKQVLTRDNVIVSVEFIRFWRVVMEETVMHGCFSYLADHLHYTRNSNNKLVTIHVD